MFLNTKDMDKTKDMFNSVVESWRRRSLGFSFYSKMNFNYWFEGSVDNINIGNPTEFKRTLKVTVDENGKLIGTVISTLLHFTRYRLTALNNS